MMITVKDGRLVEIRLLKQTDEAALYTYLQNLSDESQSRFGPHPFDRGTVQDICLSECTEVLRYIALDPNSDSIIAYMLIKKGLTDEDRHRLSRKNIYFDETVTCSFAPSVADDWQNSGLGSSMYTIIENDLAHNTSFRDILLWGGVQAGNGRAVHFYEKLGFRHFGSFWHNNMDNYEMVKSLFELYY